MRCGADGCGRRGRTDREAGDAAGRGSADRHTPAGEQHCEELRME